MPTPPFDLHHIFWGDTSLALLAEIAFRTVVMYGYALLLLRFISRRGFGTLSLFEIILIIALGAAIGEPMINTAIPLVRAFLVVSLVIGIMRLTVLVVRKSSKLEDVIEGTACRIVHNRHLDREGMRQVGYSREEVALKLRLGGIQHFGQVKGAYVESNGEVSIFTYPFEQIQAGLPLTPPWDVNPPPFFRAGQDHAQRAGYSCTYCGNTIRVPLGQVLAPCSDCGQGQWTYSWDYLDEHSEFDSAQPH